MTALDMIMLLGVGGCALFGFMRGFVQEVLSLFAWVLAVMAVRLFLAPFTDLAAIWLGTSGAAAIFSFALLFGLAYLAGRLIACRAGQRMRTSVLGPVDRVLGGGFGALKGLIGATLVFLAFTLVYGTFYGSADADRPDWMTRSRSYPLLNASGDAMSQFVAERNRKGKSGDEQPDVAPTKSTD
jgi:membrane protein required for colicin V production